MIKFVVVVNYWEWINIKKLLFLSVSINLILLLVSVLLFIKLGGLGSVSPKEKLYNDNPYYIERTNLFKQLKIPQHSIVFLGDSITHRSEWNEFFPNSKVVNRGVGSDTTEGVLNRLDEIIYSNPDKIFIMVGINDLAYNTGRKKIISNYAKILNKIQSESPNTKVFVQSVLPANNEIYGSLINNNDVVALNKELKKLSDKHGYNYVDLYHKLSSGDQLIKDYTVDGIHLKGNGYKIWVNAIQNEVLK